MNAPLFESVGIAGIGLIGGSLAKDIRTFGLADRILGWNRSPAHAERALELGLVDKTVGSLETLCDSCELIVLAMPVNVLADCLPGLLSRLTAKQIVIDVGSTKTALIETVKNHPKRGRFVACHPMAGTERSGPDAAMDGLFRNRFALIIDPQHSDADAIQKVQTLWTHIGAVLADMPADMHDTTAAMLSHMPHVLAYALSRTIKEAERSRALNARFAGGGLASMTRIAHSPISMWQPIFRQNRESLLSAIDTFTAHLADFRQAIADDDPDRLADLMK